MGRLDNIYYSVYKAPSEVPGLNHLKMTTNNDFLLNIVSMESQTLSVRDDFLFCSTTDLILFNMNYSREQTQNSYFKKIKRLIPYKKYIETFFAEYLGLKTTYSPLGIRLIITDPHTHFFNLRFILESIIQVLSVDNFMDYNDYTDYKSFSENVLLNLLLCGRWDARVDDFLLVYCIMLIRNPFTKFLLRNNDLGSPRYRYTPYDDFRSITSKARETNEAEMFWKTIESTRLSINSVISNSTLPTNKKSNLRRSSTYLVKKLRGG